MRTLPAVVVSAFRCACCGYRRRQLLAFVVSIAGPSVLLCGPSVLLYETRGCGIPRTPIVSFMWQVKGATTLNITHAHICGRPRMTGHSRGMLIVDICGGPLHHSTGIIIQCSYVEIAANRYIMVPGSCPQHNMKTGVISPFLPFLPILL